MGVNESLTVNLEMLCDCDCENPDAPGYEYASSTCRGHGDLKCGICACYEGYFGEFCQCNVNDVGGYNIDENACRRDNTSLTVCSGRGTCECNVCQCQIRKEPEQVSF